MTTRRKRNEDPAYLQLMREAKELFDAEMAKAAMKRKGRPPKTAKPAVVASEEEDELDHTEEGADDGAEEGEAEFEVEVVEEETPPPPVAKVSKAAKPAAKKKTAKAAKKR